MIALLHYALLKSAREKFLAALLAGPAVMIVAPFLGALVGALLGAPGTALRPSDFGRTEWAGMMAAAGVMISSLSAGAGGFWIFRREMANRSLGLFVLAARPRAIALAATIYGAAAGMAAFLIIVACTAVLTRHLPPDGMVFLAAFVCTLAASALGAVLITVSPEKGMLVPLYAGSIAMSVLVTRSKGNTYLLAVLAAGLLLAATAAMLMRRRCAI
jgi:hypothetical protein